MRRALLFFSLLLTASSVALAAATWEVQTSGVAVNLNSIHAISPSTAVAVGEDKAIVRTTDYGATWATEVTSDANRDLNTVYFSSATTGYAAGHNSFNNWSYMLKSVDGGDSWAEILNTSSDVLEINAIHFINDTTGWAVGSPSATNAPVMFTNNGGATWTGVGSGPGKPGVYTYDSVFFINASIGWVVGDDNGSTGGKIYKTTDGGTTWTAQTYSDPKATDSFSDIYFLDANTGWIAGNVHDFGPGDQNGTVTRTTNGGANWTLINTHLVPRYSNVDFVDANNGWMSGTGNNAMIVKSTDSGATWGIDSVGGMGIAMNGLDMVDQYNGWAVGGSGLITRYKTDPTITSIAPSTASQGDTLNVVIQGTNFLPDLTAADVTFSGTGVTVNSLVVDSATQITINITIAGGATIGLRDFTVTNKDTGTKTETNAFSINPFGITPPTVTAIAPAAGGQGATMDITLTGTNFHANPTLVFRNGGITVNSTTLVSSTTLQANITIAANASPTLRALTVTNSDDQGVTTVNNIFQVNLAPALYSVLPGSAYAGNTGINLYITGANFQTGATVTFSSADITAGTVQGDATSLRTPVSVGSNAVAGAYSLIVTNPDNGRATLANAFTISGATPNPQVTNNRGLAFPNPANPNTGVPVTLQFNLSKPAKIAIRIYNIAGQKIAELAHTGVAGINKAAWNYSTYDGHGSMDGLLNCLIVNLDNNTVLAKTKLMIQHR